MSFLTKLGRLGLGIALLLTLVLSPGCPPSSPLDSGDGKASGTDSDDPLATPPSGPIEIPGPTALRFPSRVTIDVSTTTTEGLRFPKAKGGSSKRHGGEGCTGEFCSLIWTGSNNVDLVNQAADQIMAGFGNFEVESGTSVTLFTAKVPNSAIVPPEIGMGAAGGPYYYEGDEITCDFSRYDSAKKETQECSGSVSGNHVCFRCWKGNKGIKWRLIAGFFTSVPTETNNGAGFLWYRPFDLDAISSYNTCIAWNHADPSRLVTEQCVSYDPDLAGRYRSVAIQEGEDEEGSIKTVFVNNSFTTFLAGTDFSGGYRSIGRWKEDEDFWSGKISSLFPDLNGGTSSEENLDICALLSTGELVHGGHCPEMIETDALEFIEPSSRSDLTFPSDEVFPRQICAKNVTLGDAQTGDQIDCPQILPSTDF